MLRTHLSYPVILFFIFVCSSEFYSGRIGVKYLSLFANNFFSIPRHSSTCKPRESFDFIFSQPNWLERSHFFLGKRLSRQRFLPFSNKRDPSITCTGSASGPLLFSTFVDFIADILIHPFKAMEITMLATTPASPRTLRPSDTSWKCNCEGQNW